MRGRWTSPNLRGIKAAIIKQSPPHNPTRARLIRRAAEAKPPRIQRAVPAGIIYSPGPPDLASIRNTIRLAGRAWRRRDAVSDGRRPRRGRRRRQLWRSGTGRDVVGATGTAVVGAGPCHPGPCGPPCSFKVQTAVKAHGVKSPGGAGLFTGGATLPLRCRLATCAGRCGVAQDLLGQGASWARSLRTLLRLVSVQFLSIFCLYFI